MKEILSNTDLKELFGFKFVSKDIETLQENEIQLSAKEIASNIQKYDLSISENYLKLELPNNGRFIIKDGNCVSIEHNKGQSLENVLVFLYGTCVGALLFQRGLVPLHGSAVMTENGAVLFLGQSGAGKSTTAAALNKRGYSFVSDDICALKLEGGTVYLIPSGADLKLWKQSMNLLEASTEGLSKVRTHVEKYYFPIEPEEKQLCRISKIYLLSTHNKEEIAISDPLKGVSKLHAVSENTYRQKFIHGLNRKNEHFKIISTLLPKIPVIPVLRPHSGKFNDLIDLIEEDMLR